MGLQSQVEIRLEGVDDILQSSATSQTWQMVKDQMRHKLLQADLPSRLALYITDVPINAEGHVVPLVEEQLP